jgi:hypothetical protein
MSKSKRSSTGLGGILGLIIVAALAYAVSQGYITLPGVSTGAQPAATEPAGAPAQPTSSGAQPANAPGQLPPVSFKQTPKEITFHGCPGEGDGGDPVLNRNKNRVDDGNYQQIDFSTLLNLPWPKETERTDHDKWSQAAADQVAQAEGLPVMIEGYLADAKKQGPETPNCHSTTDDDFHIWLIDHPGDDSDRAKSIVVEMTPRVRDNHPGWTTANLVQIARAGVKVRISGWIMLDPEHPDQVGKTRGTIWEIHPVMEVQVSKSGSWVTLDNY